MKKQKKKRRYSDIRKQLQPGQASTYIHHFESEIQPGDKVIVCCRVSQHVQRRRGNLLNQESSLRRAIELRSAIVVDVVTHEGSGFDCAWLARAAHLAKQHSAKLLAESTDRYVRHPAYHSRTNPDAQARDIDLQCLQQWTDGVVLVTLLPPDAPPSQVRSYQRKRGQEFKRRKGGRLKRRRGKYKRGLKNPKAAVLSKVWWLSKVKPESSVRDIASTIDVAHSTVHGWLRKLRAGPVRTAGDEDSSAK